MGLRADKQELLVRTGAGTPMGELFRRYWTPILLASELPEPDCPPVRVKVMGEELIAFRDTDGKLGLIEEYCSHRGVSLYFGRNEERGLRCPYHGFKFDVTGRCVDTPTEPEDPTFKDRVGLKGYPCEELGGIIWTYMGPAEHKPELPKLEWAHLPASHVFVSKRLQESNYLQAMEGGIDSSHVSFLHSFNLDNDPLHEGTGDSYYLIKDRSPKFEVVESDGGLLIGASRNAAPGKKYWRITQWIMPWYTIIPPFGEHPLGGHAWVPIDDENCWAWSVNYHPVRPLTEKELAPMRAGEGIHCEYVPGTFRPKANKDNDYLIDRKAQKNGGSYSGVKGIAIQDASLQESMGPIQNRTRENLTSTDNGIIMARNRLMKAALALRDHGTTPPGLDPESTYVRSACIVLDADVVYKEGAKEALVAKTGKPHVSVARPPEE